MNTILFLNGPNLNLLGTREPDLYGHLSLAQINTKLKESTSLLLDFFQSNHEGELIERIHQAKTEKTACIVFNPGAFTHTSIALRDALLAVTIPFIEVHLSNIFTRESFRHISYFSDIAAGIIMGFGPLSYFLALQAAEQLLKGE